MDFHVYCSSLSRNLRLRGLNRDVYQRFSRVGWMLKVYFLLLSYNVSCKQNWIHCGHVRYFCTLKYHLDEGNIPCSICEAVVHCGQVLSALHNFWSSFHVGGGSQDEASARGSEIPLNSEDDRLPEDVFRKSVELDVLEELRNGHPEARCEEVEILDSCSSEVPNGTHEVLEEESGDVDPVPFSKFCGFWSFLGVSSGCFFFSLYVRQLMFTLMCCSHTGI